MRYCCDFPKIKLSFNLFFCRNQQERYGQSQITRNRFVASYQSSCRHQLYLSEKTPTSTTATKTAHQLLSLAAFCRVKTSVICCDGDSKRAQGVVDNNKLHKTNKALRFVVDAVVIARSCLFPLIIVFSQQLRGTSLGRDDISRGVTKFSRLFRSVNFRRHLGIDIEKLLTKQPNVQVVHCPVEADTEIFKRLIKIENKGKGRGVMWGGRTRLTTAQRQTNSEMSA